MIADFVKYGIIELVIWREYLMGFGQMESVYYFVLFGERNF